MPKAYRTICLKYYSKNSTNTVKKPNRQRQDKERDRDRDRIKNKSRFDVLKTNAETKTLFYARMHIILAEKYFMMFCCFVREGLIFS